MTAPERVQVLEDQSVPTQDMRNQLEEFLKRKHVKDGLPKAKYTRLEGLIDSLNPEQTGRVNRLSEPCTRLKGLIDSLNPEQTERVNGLSEPCTRLEGLIDSLK